MSTTTGRLTGGMLSLRSLACLGALVAVLTTAATSSGFASSQGTTSRRLGTSSAAVTACDSDGVSVTPNTNVGGTAIVSVTVGAVASACAGATLSVDLTNGTAHANGSTTVPAGGGSATVTFASSIAPSDWMHSELTLAGP